MRGSAWNRPAAFTSGAWNAPAIWASSTSRDGSSASASISVGASTLPLSTPPLRINAGLFLPKSRSALAAPAGSPRTKAIATGPSSNDTTSTSSGESIARRASVFLNTLYSVPLGRSDARSSASSCTFNPRYSVSTVASDSATLARISSTTATFSGRAMCDSKRN